MSAATTFPARPPHARSTADELISLGWEINANQYRVVHLAARFADEENEAALLTLARERSANRLTVAIARFLADEGETDAERDARLHEARSLTTWTDGDGMTVIRAVLPPSVAKPVVVAIDELVRRIAQSPSEQRPSDLSAEPVAVADDDSPNVGKEVTERESGATAVASAQPSVTRMSLSGVADDGLRHTLRELERQQPDTGDDWGFPTLGQQRADAFVALFLGLDGQLITELVIHVRGDGVTFDDGTPTTNSAVLRQLDHAFIRLLVHDAERRHDVRAEPAGAL